MPPRRGRSRTGCLTCRVRHLKCDEEQPVCRRCRVGKRNCRRNVRLTFRYGLSASESAEIGAAGEGLQVFAGDQPWVSFSKRLTFVDETDTVRFEYCSNEAPTPESCSHDSTTVQPATALPVEAESADTRSPLLVSSDPLNEQLLTGADDTWPDPVLHEFSVPETLVGEYSPHNAPNVVNAVMNGVEKGRLKVKIPDHDQAVLVRHYTDNLAEWLDVCDVSRTYQFIVPDIATRDPIVLTSLQAFSACHLSRVSHYDPALAEAYYDKSVALLIRRLDDEIQRGVAGTDEMVLVATIFLRLYEQMNASIAGVDSQQHLSGSSAFVNAQAHRDLVMAGGVTGTFLSPLHEASFWSFLRQDIDMALVNQRPPKVELSLCRVTWDDDASDCTWAKWMIWIVAEVASLCFAEGKRAASGGSPSARMRLREEWAEMKAKCNRWWQSKPEGFDPLYYQPRDTSQGRWFPEIWFSSPWHITGIQYYHAAMVLMAVHDPFRLKSGRDYMRIHRQLRDEVLHHAREMVGVCFGRREDVPARLTLTHAIVACGAWFEGRVEQDLILELLREHDKKNGWPTETVVTDLLVDWGWLESESPLER